MSRMFEWWVVNNLKNMGWPRTKGFFKKTTYVDATVLDMSVEGAVHICVGLGAGRPKLAARLLTDTFANNPWTKKSTRDLLNNLTDQGEAAVATDPGLAPWTALMHNHRLAEYTSEVNWEQMSDPQLRTIWYGLGSSGLIWGLNHNEDLEGAFANAKATYETNAARWKSLGLTAEADYAWETLDDFYESCEEFVHLFEGEGRSLAKYLPRYVRRRR
jgi:hypothetical protein